MKIFAAYTYRRADNGAMAPCEAKVTHDATGWHVRLLSCKGQLIASATFPEQPAADAYARRKVGMS
jgi:hypothetical protein